MPYTDRDRDRDVETHTMMKVLSTGLQDHEGRIRKVESNQLKTVGALGALTFMINGALAWFHR